MLSSSNRTVVRAAAWSLAGAVVVTLATPPQTRAATVITASCLAALAPLLAARLHRTRLQLPWAALSVQIGFWTASFVAPAGGNADVPALLVQAGAGVAVLLLAYLFLRLRRAGTTPRRAGERLGRRADQMAVSSIVALGLAQVVVTARTPDSGWAAIAPLDFVLIALLLRFALSRRELAVSSVLALTASLLTGVYDLLVATTGTRAASPDDPLTVVWVAAACLYVAAALHPSMARVFSATILQSRRTESARLLGLAPLALAPVGLYAVGGTDAGVRLPTVVYLGAGAVVALVVVLRGAQALRTAERRAAADPLTGLANRRGLAAAFDQLVGKAALASGGGRLCLVDLDDFKQINDTLGHETGDRLLRSVGERLRESVGASGTVARSGGDEYVLLLTPGAADPEEILAAVFGTPLRVSTAGGATGLRTVRASAGWTELATGDDLAERLAEADIALYAAKGQAKGRVARFRPEMRADVLGKLALIEDLGRLLDGGTDAGRLVVRYQPLVSLGDDRVHGCEALVRWEHPEHGLLAPDRFLAAAEEHGLAGRLDRWVLQESLAQLGRWDTAGLPQLFVAVNLGRTSMIDPLLAQVVQDELATAGIAPDRLHLEITEHAELPDGAGVAALAELHRAGVQVSLDDFGVGYTALDYVRRYPVRVLKLDRSITAPLQHEETSALLRGIVLLARELGLDVLAEGIETDAQKARLSALGVGFGQGYLIARPLPPEDVAVLLGAPVPAPRRHTEATAPDLLAPVRAG